MIRAGEILPVCGVHFLAHCYRFVAVSWQHASRESSPDQGFERQLREGCICKLPQEWTVSQHREMQLGYGLDTASGVLHEVDIVARHPDLTAILEMKNRGYPADKNDVVVFFAKIVDYLAANPSLLQRELCPTIMSTSSFEPHALGACVGLGIHPMAPGLRPLPLLVDNGRRMENEIKGGLQVSKATAQRFEDYCARVNSLALVLSSTWFSKRFGAISESRIVVKAISPMQIVGLGQEMQQLSADCSALLYEFQQVKGGCRP